MNVPRLTRTLLSTLLISLAMAGCGASMPTKPTTPSGLTVIAGDGMVCYPESDNAQLMVYILELERGYNAL